jgi:uncharacterized repeat protein (TIGR03803 family)
LYGTTFSGGANGTGTVYEITPNGVGWNLTVLHTFGAFTGSGGQYGANADGAMPQAGPILATDGYLYGAASYGGAYGYGTLYRIAPNGVFTDLHDFTAYNASVENADGATPQATLIQATDGNLYGETYYGGVNGRGTIFQLKLDGTFTSFHAFNLNDGANPYTGLIQGSDGNLYGTTANGGVYGHPNGQAGTIFQLTLGGTLTTLYSFTGGSDGCTPFWGVIRDSSGNLYGTTYAGGPNGDGVVFELSSTGAFTVLHTFSALNGSPGTNNDGAYPSGGLVQDSNKNLWGATIGGGINGTGTYYRMAPDGSHFTSFPLKALNPSGDNSGGDSPRGVPIRDGSGNLYLVAVAGGSNGAGAIDQISPDGLLLTPIHSFEGGTGAGDAANPQAPLIQGNDGAFYGTALNGGANNTGALFKVANDGAESVLYSFSPLTSGTNPDGAYPQAALLQTSDGTLYGTASAGGPSGWGTLFNFSPSASLSTLYAFTGNAGDGATPDSALTQDTLGNLLGTTRYGGINGSGNNGFGTAFSFKPTGLAYLTSFAGKNGAQPLGALVQDAAGNSYGVCSTGGANGNGNLFKISATGVLSTLYDFSALNASAHNSDGANPVAGLVLGADGNLYGTTERGGANGTGTVFKVSVKGKLTTLHVFSGVKGSANTNPDGANPVAALVQGSELGTSGNFYGTTSFGGSHGYGTLFQVTSSGKLTTLHSFTSLGEGAQPSAALLQGTDGNFYGTTSIGGAVGEGTVFSLDAKTPAITLLTPGSASAGSAALTLLVSGGNYTPKSVVSWNGVSLVTTYVSSQSLKAAVPASSLLSKGKVSVTVVSASTGVSNGATFTIR